MMKKVLLASVVALAASTSTFAACSQASGFHAGIRAGVSMNSTKTDLNDVPANGGALLFSGNGLSTTDFVGEIFAGYNAVFNNFLIGAQLFVGTPGSKATVAKAIDIANNSIELNSKKGFAFGGSINVGAALSKETVGYIKLGLDYAKWTFGALNNTAGGVLLQGAGPEASKNVLGFSPGLGLSTMLTRNVFLTAEWKYTFWGKVSNGTALRLAAAGNAAAAVASYKPRTSTFLVGVGYKF